MTLDVLCFGGTQLAKLDLPLHDEAHTTPALRWVRARRIESVLRTGETLPALVLDARTPDDLYQSLHLLRALFDDARNAHTGRRYIHPQRVLAVIAQGDVEAAFALGRFGLAGVVESHALSQLPARLSRVIASRPEQAPLEFPAALAAPLRTEFLVARGPEEAPPVAIGYRHAPETLAALERYCTVLRAHAHESTVFEDVATLIDVMVREGLTCQTNLAAKAGATHSGQFIGSFEYYRALRRTRYGRIPDAPLRDIAMDVFIAVDEVLHEVLHILFLANDTRAGVEPTFARVAEEFSATWWQGIVHNKVFPHWLTGKEILEINDDFLLCEQNQTPRGFWKPGHVFGSYASYPWVRYVLAQLPERRCYIGERADLPALIQSLHARPEAAFLVPNARERLAMLVPFTAYPPVPAGFQW